MNRLVSCQPIFSRKIEGQENRKMHRFPRSLSPGNGESTGVVVEIQRCKRKRTADGDGRVKETEL